MFKGLAGKSAIVTGGATLMGEGLVRAFCAAGVKVVIADIDVARGEALADSLTGRLNDAKTNAQSVALRPSV